MIKVTFIIGGEEYKALFFNMEEVGEFMIVQDEEVKIENMEQISFFDMINDKDFEQPYRVELAYRMLNPFNPQFNKKTYDMEKWLQVHGVKIEN